MKKYIENKAIVSTEGVEVAILAIRGQKVMLDSVLALLYDVDVKRLNESVRRNRKRFPKDFMFQLTKKEFEDLRSQFATADFSKNRYTPYVFTEYGVAMLSSVLRSERAIMVNIEIMRAFGKLRHHMGSQQDLSMRMDELERKSDAKFQTILEVIEKLMEFSQESERLPIGFIRSHK